MNINILVVLTLVINKKKKNEKIDSSWSVENYKHFIFSFPPTKILHRIALNIMLCVINKVKQLIFHHSIIIFIFSPEAHVFNIRFLGYIKGILVKTACLQYVHNYCLSRVIDKGIKATKLYNYLTIICRWVS